MGPINELLHEELNAGVFKNFSEKRKIGSMNIRREEIRYV